MTRWLSVAPLRLLVFGLSGGFAFTVIDAGTLLLKSSNEAVGLGERPVNSLCLAPQRPPQATAVTLQAAVRTGFTMTVMVQLPTQASTWYMVNRAGYMHRHQRTGKSISSLA